MKTTKKLFAGAALLVLLALFAACGNNEQQNSNTGFITDSSLIRNKNIDVSTIDENKDGFVYQCYMHTNVISDSAGECSICLMPMKKVTVAEAQKKLNENN